MTETIRKAIELDASVLSELTHASIHHATMSSSDGNRLISLTPPSELIELIRAATVMVAEVDCRVVAFIIAYGRGSPFFARIAPFLCASAGGPGWRMNWTHPRVREAPNLVYVDKKTVHPDFRRRGIASRLYQALERELPGSVLLGATVDRPYFNYASAGFRQRNGFTRVATFYADDFLGFKNYQSGLYAKNLELHSELTELRP